jgi:signal peptidase I
LPPRRHRRAITRGLTLLVSVAVIGVSITTKLGWATYTVKSASMEPTLHCAASARCKGLEADQILANRWIYLVRPVHRRDVVILKTGGGWCGNPGLVVKRVIGIPGDRVRVVGRAVYLNGRLVTAMATRERVRRPTRVRVFRLRDGHYFVLGDNTEIACDSRTHGAVTRRMLVGKAVFIWSPLRRMRFL